MEVQRPIISRHLNKPQSGEIHLQYINLKKDLYQDIKWKDKKLGKKMGKILDKRGCPKKKKKIWKDAWYH